MIFVTVGTHEQPFDRLVEYIDRMAASGEITEEVIIQTGYSEYEPAHCTWQKLYPYQDMIRLIDEARIVITHGGPSSFIMPLQVGKTPIVVPRQFRYDEHVNDHQVRFVEEVAQRMGSIIPVIEVEELSEVIKNYDTIIKDKKSGAASNNARFNSRLQEIVDELFEGKKKKKKGRK